ncbi:peptidyl-dipeptidase Dcp [Xenorhabdus nematophila]|uniref:peptidyl-dipeptidase Dcp n=1 Tax=Xenorhabdus nematophila TaxID=628 RepID=UPI0005440EE8|nr:peptidyl-dipeptidase Dcp [Xenorhabdus nematophila]CEF33229.1 dipeptidyl carboxypeptidase II [Xenorhabdus nematophila str. Websteri]AYA41236.1 peptidyl-dipeptidase Dcp [Xenorhabdus nematophila]KHD27322.1 dipeptidyl carboxypeptidase II [Xenorhabdus nematophila]MBA0019976.1 peptidyl-dipeptidase Dcp [Xenorhabdus nematophila]MCB4426370.1 peptidyl-dipeptidase Dcp [Xenorhabdus nematophila]
MRLSTLVLAISLALSAQAQAEENKLGSDNTNISSDQIKEANVTDGTDQQQYKHKNPFFYPSALPFQAPPFDKIKEADYAPAIAAGIKQKLAEVAKIANNPAPPNFKNTFVALEKSGAMLTRVMNVFGAMTSANTTDQLQKLDEEMSPKLAAMEDEIMLNSQLFSRIKTIYQQRETLKLVAPESRRLVEVTYQRFELAGANLSDQDKAKLKALNQEAATLSTQFTNKLLTATKNGALAIQDKAKLNGLSDGEIAAAAQAASERKLDKQWLLVLQNTTQQPGLQDLKDRDTRQALFDASWSRAEKGDDNDTRQTLTRLAKVRAEQAALLGFPDYASWKLQNQMAKTPEAALKFLRDIVPAATARAEREAKDIQAVIDQQQGNFKLEAWDWPFYAEQVRKAKYDLDESQIKPYFELNNVLNNGVFYSANLLYGITFKERRDIPVYQADVRVYEVFDKNRKPLALFYTDYFKRDNKGGGAWMSNFVDQSKLFGTKPVIYNVTNFTKPAPGQPALLSYDDVITLFHEFGHALHGMFAAQEYPTLSGTNTARDFVEFPSQFNEYWARDPKVFAHYAKHYQTGEAMPQALVDKINKADKFNKGYLMTELLSAALLDMHWHMLAADQPQQNVDTFEANALKQDNINLSYVPPRYRSSYFKHIWGGGYAAGYYAYLWTEMLADDAFAWFTEHGGLTPENGQRFHDKVLSRGNSKDLEKLYIDWRGKPPSIEHMLKNRGLKE